MFTIENMGNPVNPMAIQEPDDKSGDKSVVSYSSPVEELTGPLRTGKPIFNRKVSHVPEQSSASTDEKIIGQLIRCEEDLDKGKIPLEFPDLTLYSSKEWISKFKKIYEKPFIDKHCMFALVDQTWTAKLARKIGDAKCLEVCAGKGWLAKALATNNIEIIATDINPPEDCVFAIEKIAANDAIHKYNFDYLVVSWAHRSVLDSCFKKLKSTQKIIYIGPEENEERGWVSQHAFESTEILDKWEIPHLPSAPSHIFFLKKREI